MGPSYLLAHMSKRPESVDTIVAVLSWPYWFIFQLQLQPLIFLLKIEVKLSSVKGIKYSWYTKVNTVYFLYFSFYFRLSECAQ